MEAKKRLTFTIVEDPNYNERYEVHYDDYKREYLNRNKTLDEVDKGFTEIPQCVLSKWRKRIREEENIKRRTSSRPLARDMQYIHELAGGRYQISKILNGKMALKCGVYDSLETCKKARDIIWENDFNEAVIKAVIEEYGEDNYMNPTQYYALSRYDEFEELYEDPYIRCNDILTDLNFSQRMYDHCLKEYRRRHPNAPKKRITKSNKKLEEFGKRYSPIYERPLHHLKKQRNGNYTVCKVIDKVQRYYGTYNNVEDAKKRRDELIKRNWVDD